MSDPLPSERREHTRVPLALAVSYEDHTSFLNDWTENVSEGGLFVQSESPRAPGEFVHLKIRFPGLLEPVNISGTVTWVRERSEWAVAGFGVQVESEGHRRRLAELALMANAPAQKALERPFKVLIVEDNESVVEMYARVLRRVQRVTEGSVQTQFASNGLEACRVLTDFRPDLILTDLYMPVMDGLALCRLVKENDDLKDTPVIVITAGSEEERAAAAELGVDAFLQKPVQFGQILETIARLVHVRGQFDDQEREQRSETAG
ncbi:MAG: TIGR02266 family protein [Myxococcota bacterium]